MPLDDENEYSNFSLNNFIKEAELEMKLVQKIMDLLMLFADENVQNFFLIYNKTTFDFQLRPIKIRERYSDNLKK